MAGSYDLNRRWIAGWDCGSCVRTPPGQRRHGEGASSIIVQVRRTQARSGQTCFPMSRQTEIAHGITSVRFRRSVSGPDSQVTLHPDARKGFFKMRSGVVFDNLLPERQSFIYQTPCTSSRIDKQDTERAANRLPFFWLSPSAFFPPFPFSYVRSLSRSLLAFFYVRGGEPAHLWMRQNRRNEWLEEKVAGGITEDLRHFIAWITLRMRLLQEEGRRVGAGLFKRFQWLHTGLSNNIQQDNMTELFFFDRPNQGARERKMERKKLCCWFLSSSCYYDYLSHAKCLT